MPAPSRSRRTKRRSKTKFVVAIVFALLVMSGVVYGGAIAAGLIAAPDLAALFGRKPTIEDPKAAEIVQPPGTVATFFSPREIPAYTRITRDMLLDEKERPVMKFYKPADIPKHWITNGNDILGRVLAIDKMPGRVFTEKDFFPPGTAEGIVAGVPPGMRAIVVSPKRIQGLSELKRYNRFEVFKSDKYSEIVVSNGIVVQPARRMLSKEEQARLAREAKGRRASDRDFDLEDVTIAVTPADVDRLSRALAATESKSQQTSTLLHAVVHSGRPDGEQDVHYALKVPIERRQTTIEEIRGTNRRRVVFEPAATSAELAKEAGGVAQEGDASVRPTQLVQ